MYYIYDMNYRLYIAKLYQYESLFGNVTGKIYIFFS